MKSLIAVLKKELLEHLRTGKLMILGILFVLLGIMNPAIAKLTPWLLEILADSLAASGLNVTATTVSAMDSWMQFFKNVPMALIAFVLIESNIISGEYQSGTLVMSLTKGLARHKVIIAKSVVLTVLWTFCYWLSFGITFAYNAYFWDNSIANHLVFSVCCCWIFGLFIIALMILFSTVAKTNVGVLVGTGGVVLISYLFSALPTVNEYLPTLLLNGTSLIYSALEVKDYIVPLIITVSISIASLIVSIPIFNKKQL